MALGILLAMRSKQLRVSKADSPANASDGEEISGPLTHSMRSLTNTSAKAWNFNREDGRIQLYERLTGMVEGNSERVAGKYSVMSITGWPPEIIR